jgi:hypothetical protein
VQYEQDLQLLHSIYVQRASSTVRKIHDSSAKKFTNYNECIYIYMAEKGTRRKLIPADAILHSPQFCQQFGFVGVALGSELLLFSVPQLLLLPLQPGEAAVACGGCAAQGTVGVSTNKAGKTNVRFVRSPNCRA